MISVCILAKNSERSLSATLESLRLFDEVVLLDTGSRDSTMSIAKSFPNVCVHESPFTGFGLLRNQLSSIAKHDWILAIDSDEVLSKGLQEEILKLPLDPKCVYEIDFLNYYNGKRILGCGWHPERHIRLYHRGMTRFSDAPLHEGVLADGLRIVRLKNTIDHTPYLSLYDFLAKMQHYSDLFARQYAGKRSSSFPKAFIHGLAAFFKCYIFKRGFSQGVEGAIISIYNATTAFYKYLKLAEANKTL